MPWARLHLTISPSLKRKRICYSFILSKLVYHFTMVTLQKHHYTNNPITKTTFIIAHVAILMAREGIFIICRFSWISIVQLIKFNHKLMYNHLRPNIHIKVGGRYVFIRIFLLLKFVCTVPLDSAVDTCCDIRNCNTAPPERAAYKKLMKTLKNHWIIQICPKFNLLICF